VKFIPVRSFMSFNLPCMAGNGSKAMISDLGFMHQVKWEKTPALAPTSITSGCGSL